MPSSSSSEGERIWFKDPVGLLRDDRLSRFFPLAHTTLVEQLNAILRFAIYYGLVVLLFRRSIAAVFIVLVTCAVTYLVYASDRAQVRNAREALTSVGVERDPRTGEACTRPTVDNPFMNVLLTDYGASPQRPKACDMSMESVNHRVEALFEHNLYRDVNDVYHRNSNSRQFYSTASSTIPNDQAGFAEWLYGSPVASCKEGNGDVCATRIHKFLPGT